MLSEQALAAIEARLARPYPMDTTDLVREVRRLRQEVGLLNRRLRRAIYLAGVHGCVLGPVELDARGIAAAPTADEARDETVRPDAAASWGEDGPG